MTSVMQDHSYRGAEGTHENRMHGISGDKMETNCQINDSSIGEMNSEKALDDKSLPEERFDSRTDLVSEDPHTNSSVQIEIPSRSVTDDVVSKDVVRKKVLLQMFLKRKKLENAKNLIKRSKESLRLARYKSVKSRKSLKSPGCTNDRDLSSTLINDSSLSSQHFCQKDKQVDELEDKEDVEIYTCGVCSREFPAMCHLHDHMIKDEMVKGYKYNAESKVAHVDTDSSEVKEDSVPKIENLPKRRGRKRKIFSSDNDDTIVDDRNKTLKTLTKKEKNKKLNFEQHISSNTGFVIDKADLTEKALLKFEKTVENKDEHSAFFDPVSHRYGTRRSSFLKLKEEINSPEQKTSRGKPKKNQAKKTNSVIKQHENEIDKEMKYGNNENSKNKQHKNERENKIKERAYKRNSALNRHANDKDEQMEETSPESNILSALNLNRVKVAETVEGTDEDNEMSIDNTEGNLESHIDMSNVENTSDTELVREKPDGTIVYIKKEYLPEDEFQDLCESDSEYIPDGQDMKENGETSKEGTKSKDQKKQGTPSIIPCDICGKEFRRCAIARHMVKHSTARVAQCDICKKYYKTWAQCEDHKKKIHQDSDVVFQCGICLKVLKNKNNAVKHRTLHLFKGENPEINMISKAEFESARTKPCERNGAAEQAQQKDNDDSLDHSEPLNKDVTTNTDTQTSNNTENALRLQNVRYKPEKLHPCKLCPKVFKKLYRLKDHIESYHDNKTYQCDVCFAILSTSRGLWTHKGRHLLDTDPYYSEEVAQKIRMEHENVTKKEQNPRTVICDICGKEVISKRLMRHMNSHNTSRDYECDICHKRYTTKRYVTDHKVKAHGNKTSFCDICGRTFKGTTYLEKHRQTHGPKDKYCDICGKGFTTDFYLRIHKVTHTSERRYKCTQCEAAFKHKARLDIHIVERHSKGQDRPCKYCGELFPSRQKARLHERKEHEGFIMPRTKKRSSLEPSVIKVEDDVHVQYSMEEPRRGITLKMQNEDSDGVEQVIEIPENSQQCQLMILPNGVIKVLNVVEGDPDSTTEDKEENIAIQYVTEDGNHIEENGDSGIQYIEVEESEFKLLTGNKIGDTKVLEFVETAE